MQLEAFRKTKEKLLNGHYKPLNDRIDALEVSQYNVVLDDAVTISGDISNNKKEEFMSLAKDLTPWRKGPFELFGTFMDTEWRSNLKFDIIKDHLNIENRNVIDIGCNNGYYMFRMLEYKPKKLVGFDPSVPAYLQFKFFNRFIKSDINFELLGVEHLKEYGEKFDTIVCLGVLYHRHDPIVMLKTLRDSLNKDGEIIIDTLIIDGEEEICLCPKERYAKMQNVYFLPTLTTLNNWLVRAGFKEITHIATKETTTEEQRSTEWIDDRQSLDSFLDKEDNTKTVEGYPAPKRAYIKAKL